MFRKGQKVYHKTLGLVEIAKTKYNCESIWVTILDDTKRSAEWGDDWGYRVNTTEKFNSWSGKERIYGVVPQNLHTLQEHKIGPVRMRIRKLWKESNWVKNNPQLKY